MLENKIDKLVDKCLYYTLPAHFPTEQNCGAVSLWSPCCARAHHNLRPLLVLGQRDSPVAKELMVQTW